MMNTAPWFEMAGAYVLGALDEDERIAFEQELERSPELHREVDELREVAGLLAHAAPPALPPPGLRDRVLAEARQVRPISVPRQEQAPPVRKPRNQWIPWLAAAASLVLAAVAGAAYWQEHNSRLALEREYQQTVATVASRDADLASRDSLLAALIGPQVETTTLAATGQPPSIRLFWNQQRQTVVLAAFDLPPAPAGRTYQLWGIETGAAPVSLGTFTTGADGRTVVTLDVPTDQAFDVSAVTEEPAGGSPQPTTTPFLVGSWATE
jgi:anti-sigma-K factor RskA